MFSHFTLHYDVSGEDEEAVIVRGEGAPVEWQEGTENGAHSSLETSARRGEDSEHDSLGWGLCTFDTRLHVNGPPLIELGSVSPS